MFAARVFAARHFAARHFAAVGAELPPAGGGVVGRGLRGVIISERVG